MRRRDGTWRTMETIAVNRLADPAVRGIIATTRDITARKQAEEELRHQALHDMLTGLPNRALLQDRMEQALCAAQRHEHSLALLLLDLDRFKEVNDTVGHHHGDMLLQQVAVRLQSALRTSDTVARLGGDEFAVLLAEDNYTGALIAAGKISTALEAPFVIDGHRHVVHVGTSIGIALYPDHGLDAEVLLRSADVAMYVAKRRGETCAVYSSDQDHYSPERLALIADLRQAITAGGLVLHYQPKIDLATGGVTSVEALVRWVHPHHGLMRPDRFIPLAEETGLMAPMTRWVLEEAFGQCRRWQCAGIDLSVAVNVSMATLHDPQFSELIAELLQRYEVPATHLRLEVTESTLMADVGRTKEVLSRVTALGLGISIDDYGTGYSSLAYVKRLPVDELKIDMSFVRQMREDEADAAIVASTIGLGHSLGLRVVAEGVEDRETQEMLVAMGCDTAQGYYWSRPLPAAELERWLRDSTGTRTEELKSARTKQPPSNDSP